MELIEFLAETQAEIRSELGERLSSGGDQSPYAESVFAEVVMQHLAEVGMTFDDPQVCHYTATVGNAKLSLSGWALSEDGEQLDLFVSLYGGVDLITRVPDADTKTAADQCIRFLTKCAERRLAATMEESNDAYGLVLNIQESYPNLDQIRVFVLTDRVAKAKSFKPREVKGKTVKLEVMDIERLYRHWSAGKPRDELVVNFAEVAGSALPCVYVPGELASYDYALTVLPGETLRFLYDKYGPRLLEANVRSFLSVTGKVNRGIRDTLRQDPERFMAYNNGIVVVADEARLEETPGGGTRLLWLKGMQIVNGGQTTASIYFTKKKDPSVELARVRVPAKVIILRSLSEAEVDPLIADISKFANSQNSVKLSDLSANRPFHVEVEKLAVSTYCADGVGKWFYERAAGSYNVMLVREGTTPARLRKLKEAVPASRKVTKTDLAKYLNAWAEKPHAVSLGSQKNFEEFMESLAEAEATGGAEPLDVVAYKHMIAKAILFRSTQKLVRAMFPAFQANVTAYTVSLVALRLGARIELDRIWRNQAISPALQGQIRSWATQVNDVLHETAAGRMISEWAKKPECWQAVRSRDFSAPTGAIPEAK